MFIDVSDVSGVKRRKRRNTKPPAVARNFRMAYCGAATIVNEAGDALHSIRYGPMPRETALKLAECTAIDVFALRDQAAAQGRRLERDARARWSSGAVKRPRRPINTRTLGEAPYRLIDLFHLLEKLGEAAKSLHGDTGFKPVLRGWKIRLLNVKTAST